MVPDLATCAKAIGGGLPLSALAGRRALMDLISDGKVVHAGTLNGNPIVLAAAKATLERLSRNDAEIYRAIKHNGSKLRQGIEKLLRSAGYSVVTAGEAAVFHVSFMAKPAHWYSDLLIADVFTGSKIIVYNTLKHVEPAVIHARQVVQNLLTIKYLRDTVDGEQKGKAMSVDKDSIFQPIANNATLKDRTIQMLTEAILSGKIKPGERLNESQLARDLGVSRAPVREAMQQLQEQSLIVNMPRRGMFAVSLNDEEIEKINSLRIVLESEALRHARKHLTPQRKKKLKQLLATIENMGPASAKSSMPIDFEFHRTIWSYSNNEYLLKTLVTLTAPVFAHTVRTRLHGARPVRLLSHRPILDFICGNSNESAEQIMQTHVAPYKHEPVIEDTSTMESSQQVSLET